MLARWSRYASLPLRLVLGALFVMGGSQKLFGVLGGPGLQGTADFMASVGLTPGMFWACVAGLVEFIGGAALVLGVVMRWTAIVLTLESLAAIFATAMAAPNAMSVEFRLATIAGLLALSMIGPGLYALDTSVAQLRSLTEGPPPPEPIRKAA